MTEEQLEAELLAARLVAEGWSPVSGCPRRVALVHLPPVEQLVHFSEDCPEWLRTALYAAARRKIEYAKHRNWPGVVSMALSPVQFAAFRRKYQRHAGGERDDTPLA